ncbi:MAG: DUF4065 domain-containing protein [Prochloron sp. SP5CPC1]|nr:DUF4065 domain-containing protein [Candidatus Paraprochloron terpiosi SP5CPC1]
MVDCLHAAHYFICRAYENKRSDEMTNLKVQKLLYYAQSLHLALFDEPLFPEEIQAWRYGPVCPPAYHFYSEFEGKPLPKPKKASFSDIDPYTIELLEEVGDYFRQYHACCLSGMTHVEFPWRKARKALPSDAKSTEPIELADMKLLGKEKLDEIERNHPDYEKILSHMLEEAFKDRNNSRIYVKEGEVDDWLNSLLA